MTCCCCIDRELKISATCNSTYIDRSTNIPHATILRRKKSQPSGPATYARAGGGSTHVHPLSSQGLVQPPRTWHNHRCFPYSISGDGPFEKMNFTLEDGFIIEYITIYVYILLIYIYIYIQIAFRNCWCPKNLHGAICWASAQPSASQHTELFGQLPSVGRWGAVWIFDFAMGQY